MYQTSLLFKIKDNNIPNQRILDMFFKSWIDDICDNEVQYTVEHNVLDTLRVDFDKREDAVLVKLRGIPTEFDKYLEFIN